MDDDDLQKIRQARLQQLQQEQGGSGGGGGQAGQQEAQRAAEDEARKTVLTQILTPEANDRLGRIALVKADRARDLENRLIMMARSGQIRQRITDNDLKAMLEGASEQGKKEESKVVFQRRRVALDDDDDDWDL
ncbi:hypothetical protein H072_9622 [Dactylellina haptotyla CBS 200.50]|uniref:DNA-binding TFAR19-related protein n=1 Tax=Dactylellina haptotyla (strain CBS 200.50) TaxID=1284197 RepID=S8BNE4_DACHA|nr:hypothetical protein H072_9622 [Dactylellina haptotyla CBS 200.50]